jgi:hypothetical protein
MLKEMPKLAVRQVLPCSIPRAGLDLASLIVDMVQIWTLINRCGSIAGRKNQSMIGLICFAYTATCSE